MKKLLMGLVFAFFCLFAKAQTELNTYMTWTYVFDDNSQKWLSTDTVSFYTPIRFVADSVFIEGKKYLVDHDTIDVDSCYFMYCYDSRHVKCVLALYTENNLIVFSIMYDGVIKNYALIKKYDDGAVKLR